MDLLLPALLAGLVAILATVAIERLGGQMGGLISTLPTTIVPAALGIWAQDGDFAVAMYAVPFGMLLDVLFLLVWRLGPRWLPDRSMAVRLTAMVVLSLGCWFAGAVGVVLLQGAILASGTPLGPISVGLMLVTLWLGAWACWNAPPAPKGTRPVGPITLLARGTLAAAAIAGSIALAAVGGALAAGVASVFPAIFVTTMVSLWISQGEAVQAGAVGPMMLGASSVSAFALASVWTLPALGAVLGTVVAWVGAVALVTWPAWSYLRWVKTR